MKQWYALYVYILIRKSFVVAEHQLNDQIGVFNGYNLNDKEHPDILYPRYQ